MHDAAGWVAEALLAARGVTKLVLLALESVGRCAQAFPVARDHRVDRNVRVPPIRNRRPPDARLHSSFAERNKSIIFVRGRELYPLKITGFHDAQYFDPTATRLGHKHFNRSAFFRNARSARVLSAVNVVTNRIHEPRKR